MVGQGMLRLLIKGWTGESPEGGPRFWQPQDDTAEELYQEDKNEQEIH